MSALGHDPTSPSRPEAEMELPKLRHLLFCLEAEVPVIEVFDQVRTGFKDCPSVMVSYSSLN